MKALARAMAVGSAAALAGLGASACGTGSPTATQATTTTVSTVNTSSTSSTTTTTQAPPTTAATSVCRGSALTMSAAGSSGGAGTQEVTFKLVNSSGSTCTMQGYAGMLLLGPDGSALPTTVDRGGGLAFENVPVSKVTLAPGDVAYFNLGYSDVVAVPPACSTATATEVTPPTATTHGVVSHLSVQACANGTLHVSPVFGATDAAGTQTTAPPV